MSERFKLPDLLKGIAVILMIQVHLTELFIQGTFLTSQVGKISLFLGGVPAAPLFLSVLGFFIVYSAKTLKSNIQRGLKLIVLGLAINLIMNIHLIGRILFSGWKIDPLPYLLGADILFIAGISIIIIALFFKLFSKDALPFALLALIVSALSNIIPIYSGDSYIIRYPLAFIHSHDWWAYFPLIPWLSYSLIGAAAGMYFRNYNDEIMKMLSKPVLLLIPFIVVVLFWPYGFRISTDLFTYYHHSVRFFVWAIMLLIIITVIVNFLNNAVSDKNIIKRYLIWTGENVTVFYVVQWLLIGNIATSLYKSQTPLLLPIWLVTVLSSTSIIVLYWNKMRKRAK